jgi:hypothetical protein
MLQGSNALLTGGDEARLNGRRSAVVASGAVAIRHFNSSRLLPVASSAFARLPKLPAGG